MLSFKPTFSLSSCTPIKSFFTSSLLSAIKVVSSAYLRLLMFVKEILTLPLKKVKEKSEKVGLKLNIQKINIKAFGPTTSWQIDGGTVETVRDFILRGSKITAGADCSHEIKRHLLSGRKAMANLDSILKRKDITLLTKVHLVKAMVFPVVMYGCERRTIKKSQY